MINATYNTPYSYGQLNPYTLPLPIQTLKKKEPAGGRTLVIVAIVVASGILIGMALGLGLGIGAAGIIRDGMLIAVNNTIANQTSTNTTRTTTITTSTISSSTTRNG